MRALTPFLVSVALLAFGAPSHALIVYASAGLSDAFGCSSCRGAVSDYGWGNEVVDEFLLKRDVTIDALAWTGSRGDAENLDFTVNFYNTTVSGMPALNPFASFNIGNEYTLFSNLFSANLGGELRLFADVPYYFSIVANSSTGWAWLGGDGASRVQRLRSVNWSTVLPAYPSQSFGWLFEGNFVPTTVPEPGTLGSFLFGLVALTCARRRRGPGLA